MSTYEQKKRDNQRAMAEKLQKMQEESAKHEKAAIKRAKLREAHDRKLAKKKEEAEMIMAERRRLQSLEDARPKLVPSKPIAPEVDDTNNLYMYDGT